MLILQDHYMDALETELEALSQLSTYDWTEPFEVASSWARRYLGLNEETLEQAQALIIARLEDTYVLRGEDGTPTQPHQPDPTPPSARAEYDVIAQAYAGPLSGGVRTTKMATMTDETGDWSPQIGDDLNDTSI